MVQNFKWIDGYEDNEPALIDDFRVADLSHAGYQLNHLLVMLSPFSILKECKGAHILWNPPLIVITSCFDPVSAFGEGALRAGDDIGQLIRRLHAIVQFERLHVGAPDGHGVCQYRWRDCTHQFYQDTEQIIVRDRHMEAIDLLTRARGEVR